MIPQNLIFLYRQEEFLRQKALNIIEGSARLSLHMVAIERTMTLARLFINYNTEDKDLKAIQMLGIRTYNAFAASLKLALSGYSQNSALIMREILETAFLLDLFQSDRAAIERWRCSKKTEEFRPINIRKALDKRDLDISMSRAEHYEMLSGLAGHPNTGSQILLKPNKDGDIFIGPFIEGLLQPTLDEMSHLAIMVGESLDAFIPAGFGNIDREKFHEIKKTWWNNFSKFIK